VNTVTRVSHAWAWRSPWWTYSAGLVEVERQQLSRQGNRVDTPHGGVPAAIREDIGVVCGNIDVDGDAVLDMSDWERLGRAETGCV